MTATKRLLLGKMHGIFCSRHLGNRMQVFAASLLAESQGETKLEETVGLKMNQGSYISTQSIN